MTHKVIHIRLSEQINRCPAHRTHQYGPRVAEEKSSLGGSCLFIGQTLPAIQPTSIPLSPPCSGRRIPLAYSRNQKRFHRQIASETDRSGAGRSSANRHAHQRLGGKSIGGIFTKARAGTPWLSAPARAISGASGSLCQTVTDQRSWPKFTRCWCRWLQHTHH